MPRYFFHVIDSRREADDEGVLLADLEEARAQAVRTAGEILATEGMAFWIDGQWGIMVVDEGGATVFKLRFSGAA